MSAHVWLDRFKEARLLATRWVGWRSNGGPGDGLSDDERVRLFDWLRGHMGAYVTTCAAQDWMWSADCLSDLDEMAAWVRDDFDLDDWTDEVWALCEAAGWAVEPSSRAVHSSQKTG